MKKKPHFKALITYFSTEDGGIATPVSSGFRTFIKFPFDSEEFLSNHTFLESELIFPGDISNIDITLMDAKDILTNLYKGIDFDIVINSKIIGSGVVTEIYV